jgi:hypothetical protein
MAAIAAWIRCGPVRSCSCSGISGLCAAARVSRRDPVSRISASKQDQREQAATPGSSGIRPASS